MNGKTTVATLVLVMAGSCQIGGVHETSAAEAASAPQPVVQSTCELVNAAYRLTVQCVKHENGGDEDVVVSLNDKQMGVQLADGPYYYRAERKDDPNAAITNRPHNLRADVAGSRLTIHGTLAGLDFEHQFDLPADRQIMEERLVVHNRTNARIGLTDLETAFERPVADKSGQVLPELAGDRFAAVPFRAKPDDAAPHYNDFSTATLIAEKGYECHVVCDLSYSRLLADHRQSEGWAWTHGSHTLGIFKFDQENMQWSILATQKQGDATTLRFGGVRMIDGEPADLGRIEPGQTVRLGVTRYQTVAGGYNHAAYAFRAFLDENGCRFPKNFNAPVHWEQLYDMGGAWDDRLHRYTKAIVEKEAEKGVAYSCEAIYLDPGWDTGFATFLWGDAWLGPRKAFVDEMQTKYGLKVSLHTPLASWMSWRQPMGPDIASATYPPESRRKAPQNDVSKRNEGESTICLGSKAYLDEAAKRLLANCADGVTFLMYDGNWYEGGCEDRTHGHPVPFTKEDHMRANLDLARRVHEKYPDVIIEMHDMLMGGANARNTPVYYKYGLPGSYDENWGFELMWDPMVDITSGRARSLYYYNLGCNVPVYLHIGLQTDKPGLPVFWWYASTCRHLGIGGTHKDPEVVASQKAAMKMYHELERFFKRGDFYGAGEDIHLHALPGENAFVANLFNLSDKKRVIGGSMELSQMQVNGARLESGWNDAAVMKPQTAQDLGALHDGIWTIEREMTPWSAEVVYVRVAQ